MIQEQPWTISADEKLRFLPRLLNAVDQPIMATDLDGQIVYMNRCSTKLFNWVVDELHKRDINRIFTTPSFRSFINDHLDQLKQGESVSGDFIYKNREGIDIQTRIKISFLTSDLRTLIGLVLDTNKTNEGQLLQTANKISMEIDNLLGNVVDYESMLSKFTEFVIPQLADICAIYLLQPDNLLERVSLGPVNILNNGAVYDWLQNDLPNDETDGLPAVIRSGESKLVREVNSVRRAAKAGIKSYMILPIIIHRKVRGAIVYIAAESERYFDQNSLDLAQNLTKNISIYIEKNRLYKESQKLKAELEQRVNERTVELREAIAQLKQSEAMIQTLFRISNKLNATLDVDTILDELAKEAISVVNGESGFAGLRTADGMTVKKYFHMGTAIPFEHTWKIGEGIPGWVLKYKVPYGTSDAENDPLILRGLSVNDNVKSVICTPILDSMGEVIGYFDIRNKVDADGFSINDQEMLLTIAPVASIAIQNALAYKQRLESFAELKESSKQLENLAARLEDTREEERMRISRELHDQLGQALTAIKYDLTSLTEKLNNLDEDLAHKTKDILTQLNSMIKTVRRISTELRPGMLDDLGLLASIEWQADDFQKRTGIECRVNGPSDNLNLSNEQSLALYRIFQEALTNVSRYADAKHVEVKLSTNENQLYFEFHDDGRGIQEEEITGRHSLGILGMRERVKHIGGTFEINGLPDQGTTILVSIPLKINKPQSGNGDIINATDFVSR